MRNDELCRLKRLKHINNVTAKLIPIRSYGMSISE